MRNGNPQSSVNTVMPNWLVKCDQSPSRVPGLSQVVRKVRRAPEPHAWVLSPGASRMTSSTTVARTTPMRAAPRNVGVHPTPRSGGQGERGRDGAHLPQLAGGG